MSEVVKESLRNSNTAMGILDRTTKTYIRHYLLLALKSGRSFVFDFPWVAYVNGRSVDVRMKIRNSKVSLDFEIEGRKVYETDELDNMPAFIRLYNEYGFDGESIVRRKVDSMLDKMA